MDKNDLHYFPVFSGTLHIDGSDLVCRPDKQEGKLTPSERSCRKSLMARFLAFNLLLSLERREYQIIVPRTKIFLCKGYKAYHLVKVFCCTRIHCFSTINILGTGAVRRGRSTRSVNFWNADLLTTAMGVTRISRHFRCEDRISAGRFKHQRNGDASWDAVKQRDLGDKSI